MNTIKTSTKKHFPTAVFAILGVIVLGAIGVYLATYYANLAKAGQKEKDNTAQEPIVTPVPEKKIKYVLSHKLLFLGDIMTSRTIGDKILAGADPFTYVRTEFEKYDTIIGNIETNISTPGIGTANPEKLYTFNAPVETIQTIKNAGIDVAVLANNHTSDYGQYALLDMINKIKESGMKTVGAGANSTEAFEPLILTVPLKPVYEDDTELSADAKAKLTKIPNIKIALIAVNDVEAWFNKATDVSAGSAYFDETLFANAVSKVKNEYGADLVIVIAHWGYEYKTFQDVEQVRWANIFVDGGADLVVGGHPHVIQPYEEYNGKMIYYSLGNFVFDNMEGAEDGEMLSVVVNASQDVTAVKPTVNFGEMKLIPTRLDVDGFPVITQ
jgi:poly-gamma-glutamate synthesis protein (capsule biosynthesis protein)